MWFTAPHWEISKVLQDTMTNTSHAAHIELECCNYKYGAEERKRRREFRCKPIRKMKCISNLLHSKAIRCIVKYSMVRMRCEKISIKNIIWNTIKYPLRGSYVEMSENFK